MFTATLIAADRFDAGDFSRASDCVAQAGASVLAARWIDERKALDVDFTGDAVSVRAAVEGAFDRVDAIVQKHRRPYAAA